MAPLTHHNIIYKNQFWKIKLINSKQVLMKKEIKLEF